MVKPEHKMEDLIRSGFYFDGLRNGRISYIVYVYDEFTYTSYSFKFKPKKNELYMQHMSKNSSVKEKIYKAARKGKFDIKTIKY